jgi:hypothetical protein
MRQADIDHTPSRRGFLNHIGAVGALAAIFQATGPSGAASDADLLHLGRLLREASAAEQAAWLAAGAADGDPDAAEAQALNALSAEIVERIAATQATTLAGLRVKLDGIAWCRAWEPWTRADLDLAYSDCPLETQLCAGVARDLTLMRAPAG